MTWTLVKKFGLIYLMNCGLHSEEILQKDDPVNDSVPIPILPKKQRKTAQPLSPQNLL
ncbi:hypothetical protein P343_08930 [Sporolactobacillus laevolacticus DSM 442]|uniref:Uncharacterized protein n=1 Tax=Sporolactobacillus laevolacticus DSM 442 TaxID=1395513 RepID=V6IY18_9BACL|nr:hypothetical protein P343_08930 [Sporolactobacillus laevolacticus DSM 442]